MATSCDCREQQLERIARQLAVGLDTDARGIPKDGEIHPAERKNSRAGMGGGVRVVLGEESRWRGRRGASAKVRSGKEH